LISVIVNNSKIAVEPGTTVAVAIMNSGIDHFRDSVSGTERGPLCGMGICFECRVTINGIGQQRSCTLLAENGMEVTTSEPPA
jgi:sarcosine oxidase subunit alpha